MFFTLVPIRVNKMSNGGCCVDRAVFIVLIRVRQGTYGLLYVEQTHNILHIIVSTQYDNMQRNVNTPCNVQVKAVFSKEHIMLYQHGMSFSAHLNAV